MDFYEGYNTEEQDFIHDSEPLNVKERSRDHNYPWGLRNMGNTCYFNSFLQIMYFLPSFGKRILELEPDRIDNDIPKPKGKDRSISIKMNNGKNLLKSLQGLFVEMTLSNRKYANPIELINNVVDDKGNRIHIGDEEDVGEIGSRFMNALHEAYSFYEESDDSESSSSEDLDQETNFEESDQEEEKGGKHNLRSSKQTKADIKEDSYGPKAFGKELFKDPQDNKRGFIKQLFFGKKIEVTEWDKRKKDTVEESDFFQVFLSVMQECNLYDAWDSSYHYSFDGDDKLNYHKRSYVFNVPDVFTFQLMRATFDFDQNRLKKINTKFDFDEEIYIDRFLYQNWERFKKFREKLDSMYWNKTRLESNLTSYEYKGIPLDEFFNYTRTLLLEQCSKDELDMWSENIPEEGDSYEVLTPNSIGTLGLDQYQLDTTVNVLGEYQQQIRTNMEKQTFYVEKLRTEIGKAYKSSTDFPYVLHAVIIHEGEAMSGHYYR